MKRFGRWAFVVVVTLVGTRQAAASPIPIWNPGFETPEVTAGTSATGLPGAFGQWRGDASAIVTAQQGITPLEGTHMLQFVGSQNPTGQDGISSDIWQLFDMSPYHADVATGLLTATWSAYFNRIAGDSQTEPQFVISLRAFSGLPSAFVSTSVADVGLADSTAYLTSDADPSTWQQLSTSLLLPVGTQYLGLRVAARETLDNDKGNEFDGHYADQTALDFRTPRTQSVVPEPGSLMLAGTGLSALVARLRRKNAPRRT